MSLSLPESVQHCRELARRTGKNFYYSFLALPKSQRQDMCVLYAFMRVTDDLGDDESVPLDQRRANLAGWKHDLQAALAGATVEHAVLPALAELVRRVKLPERYLLDVIAGVELDLEPRRYATFADLQHYCYHVAGAVGLCCIHVWGFTSERAFAPAIACGTAFQMTNILRDLAEDIDRERVYLPQEDLHRFGYSETDIVQRVRNESFRTLMQFEVARAREFYAASEGLFEHLTPSGRKILRAMLRIYRGLLDLIESSGYDVYTRRISLPKHRKWGIVLRAMCGW